MMAKSIFLGGVPRIRDSPHGYYFKIGDVEHGHWRSKSEAMAGRNVEINRHLLADMNRKMSVTGDE